MARHVEAVEAARASGAWEEMADVDALVVPPDLATALGARPPARETFDGFPPSTRRNMLRCLAGAKRAETRATRVRRLVGDAQCGVRTATNG